MILWVANFRFWFFEVSIENQWRHKFLGSLLRNPTLVVRVQWQLREKLICFSILILNFVWKADEGETESSVLLIFVPEGFLNSRWVRGGEVGGRKSYSGLAKIASFSSRDFSQSNKHDTFWHVLSTGYFFVLFLWAIAASDFLPLEIYKNFPL